MRAQVTHTFADRDSAVNPRPRPFLNAAGDIITDTMFLSDSVPFRISNSAPFLHLQLSIYRTALYVTGSLKERTEAFHGGAHMSCEHVRRQGSL